MKSAPLLQPKCFQQLAPAQYEILNEYKKSVTPTLAGYHLVRGSQYYLRVRLQKQPTARWEVHVDANQTIKEPFPTDWEPLESKSASFKVTNHNFHLIRPSVSKLQATINFVGQDPYEFEVPIVIAHRWWAAVLAILGFVTSFFFVFKLFLPPIWAGAGVAVLIIAIAAGWFFRDHRHCKKVAKERIDQLKAKLSEVDTLINPANTEA